MARKAFRDLVAPEIIRRETKGGANNHYQRMLDANIAYVREFLLDGELVGRGLLDRTRVEDALCGRDVRLEVNPVQVLGFVCTESWLQFWRR